MVQGRPVPLNGSGKIIKHQDVMKVTLRRTLHAASRGGKLTRVITPLDGSVGVKYARKMFYKIALHFTTVSYDRKLQP